MKIGEGFSMMLNPHLFHHGSPADVFSMFSGLKTSPHNGNRQLLSLPSFSRGGTESLQYFWGERRQNKSYSKLKGEDQP